MLKQKLSLQRIRHLLRQEWAEQGRLHLFVLAGLSLALMIAMILEQNKHWENITRNDSYIREQLAFEQFFTYINNYPLWMVLSLTMVVSIAFGTFRRREDGRWYLGLPASSLEKWLSKGIVYLLIMPLLLTGIYLLLGNIHLAMLSTAGHAVRWLFPGDLRWIGSEPIPVIGVGLIGFVYLMAIWQPRYTWVKSAIVITALAFLVRFLYESIIAGVSGVPMNVTTDQAAQLGLSMDVWELSTSERARINLLLQLSFLLLALVSVGSSYFALREKQV